VTSWVEGRRGHAAALISRDQRRAHKVDDRAARDLQRFPNDELRPSLPYPEQAQAFLLSRFRDCPCQSPGQGKDAGKPQSIPRIGLMTAASRQRGYVPPGAYLPSDELTPYRGAGV
jgi:hypothetical protein